jgi:C4-dicarboxylate-specific signal transduction histidine kinase
MKTDPDWQAIAREEVCFFGNVSAGISHEINNRIAVINEKAGLLQDLARMLAQGQEIDVGRIEVQSKKIVEQVRLAKQTVRHLNRFAHSVDILRARIEMVELLQFVASLYARKAATAEVTLSVLESSEPVTITMNPFVLEILIGRAIDVSLTRVGDTRRVMIEVSATREGLTVRFGGLEGLTDPIEFHEENQEVPALLEWLGARYRSEPDGTALLLEIPVDERTAMAHRRTA